jgi:hypothetical protein
MNAALPQGWRTCRYSARAEKPRRSARRRRVEPVAAGSRVLLLRGLLRGLARPPVAHHDAARGDPARLWSCVATTTVVPRADASPARSVTTSAPVALSRFPVGSSARITPRLPAAACSPSGTTSSDADQGEPLHPEEGAHQGVRLRRQDGPAERGHVEPGAPRSVTRLPIRCVLRRAEGCSVSR